MGGFAAPELKNEDYGHASGWRADNHLCILGDVNGNGRADIAAFASDGVRMSFSERMEESISKIPLTSPLKGYSPSLLPSTSPTFKPTLIPSVKPSSFPSFEPSSKPSSIPLLSAIIIFVRHD